jgi:dynein heavy chain 1, cytosolic
MLPTIEKKIAELEMGLLSIQQNTDIPEVNFSIHPYVMTILKKCAQLQRKPCTDDYDEKANDSNFLNQLQSGVNKWIKEIQNVGINTTGKQC